MNSISKERHKEQMAESCDVAVDWILTNILKV